MARKPKATGWPQLITEQGLWSNTAAAKYPLGMVAMDTYGNFYRYIKANEALAIGQIVTHVAEGLWDSTIVCDGAVASGDTKIRIDTLTTAMTANQYEGYYITQAQAAAKGGAYRIGGHPSIAATTGDGDCKIADQDTVGEVFADGAALRIFNPYLMELVDADTEMIRGVAVGTITSAYHGFIQVGGFCPVIQCGHTTSAAVVINEPLVPVAAVPGAVQGMAGGDEADVMEAACSPLISLRAVAANTPGYTCGMFSRIV